MAEPINYLGQTIPPGGVTPPPAAPRPVNYLGQTIPPGGITPPPAAPPPVAPRPVMPGAAPAGAPVSGADMHELIGLLHDSMQQQGQAAAARNQLQSGALFGRHLGTGGGEVTPTNPSGNAADPWSSGGLFHGGFGATMDPEAIHRSQGGTAENQWRDVLAGRNTTGGAPSGMSPQEGAVRASPSAFHISPSSQAMLNHATGGAVAPTREPDLYDIFGAQAANQTIPHATMPRSPRSARPRINPTATPPPSANGSPRPGFSFGGFQ